MLRRSFQSTRVITADSFPGLWPDWHLSAKRVTDVLLASLGLLLCWPLLVVAGLLVRLTSPGPVIYKQERVGKGGRPFTIYKLRSMVAGAEPAGPALSCQQDSRITPWGRWMRKVHLDELPQLYNVLAGHMSLVGPRPERRFYIDQILKRAPQYQHLLQVRPGITSLGLVKFGYAQNIEEMVRRMRFDLLYLEKRSFAMDLRVMLYTIKAVLQGRGQ